MSRLILIGLLAYLVYKVIRFVLPQFHLPKSTSKSSPSRNDLTEKYDIQDADFEDIDESS